MYLSTLYAAVIKVIVMGLLLKHVQSLLLRQLTASSLMHTSLCLYVFVHFVCSSYLSAHHGAPAETLLHIKFFVMSTHSKIFNAYLLDRHDLAVSFISTSKLSSYNIKYNNCIIILIFEFTLNMDA